MNFELEKLYSVEFEDNALPLEAIIAASDYMKEHFTSRVDNSITSLFSWSDSNSDWRKWKTAEGTWIKRFQSYLFNTSQYKLASDDAAALGELLVRHMPTGNLYFEIDKYVDWKPGAFAERNNSSCWWDEYNPSRIGLGKDPRGYAVLIYGSPEHHANYRRRSGIGRCWLWNESDYMVLFNAYGIPLPTIAGAVGKALNLSYQKVKVMSEGSYINMGTLDNEEGRGGRTGVGYVLSQTFSDNVIDIGDIRVKDASCQFCKKEIFARESIKFGGRLVCKKCCDLRLFSCGSCGRMHNKTDATPASRHGHGVEICKSCATRYADNVCEVHGLCVNTTHKAWHIARKYCSTCIDNKIAVFCTACGHLSEKYATIGNRTLLCGTCIKKAKNAEIIQHEH